MWEKDRQARQLQHLRSSSYGRCTPDPGTTARLCPIQATATGGKLARGLKLLSPMLKAVLSEMSLY